jgi:hypothetical protein
VKFIDGFPGEYVVIARRAGEHWYVAGINADRNPRRVTIDLKSLGVRGRGQLITDGDDALGFSRADFPRELATSVQPIEMRARGGFVLVF